MGQKMVCVIYVFLMYNLQQVHKGEETEIQKSQVTYSNTVRKGEAKV